MAVLFARSDSIYKTIGGLEVYDIGRDARSFSGSAPVIAHPPCRAWGRLRHLAKPRHDEKDLAHFAVEKVRKNGGILEHPEFSTLWAEAGLPFPGKIDEYGGYTIPLPQYWFGHLARKNTWLYVVGVKAKDLPLIPFVLGESNYVVGTSSLTRKGLKKEITKSHREKTPLNFALWLVDVARSIEACRAR